MQAEPTRTGTPPARTDRRTPPLKIRHTEEGYRARGPSEQEALRRMYAKLQRDAKSE